MGDKTVIYQRKVNENLRESFRHLERLDVAFDMLEKKYRLPLETKDFEKISSCTEDVAFSDQIIYRFSKLQDCMGAKLFKSVLLYQGENINKPFWDILNKLETIDIIRVDEWFEIRDLKNEIAHDYEDNNEVSMNILNKIYNLRNELKSILNSIENLIN